MGQAKGDRFWRLRDEGEGMCSSSFYLQSYSEVGRGAGGVKVTSVTSSMQCDCWSSDMVAAQRTGAI